MPAAGVDSPAHAIQRAGNTLLFGSLCVSRAGYTNGKHAAASARVSHGETWRTGTHASAWVSTRWIVLMIASSFPVLAR
jgi:hypothetical protein